MPHVTMIDIFRMMLPLGVMIAHVEEQAEAYKIELSKGDQTAVTFLRKCVVPGYERRYCLHAIVNAMSTMAVKKEQWTVAQAWLEKLQEPRHGEFSVFKVDTTTGKQICLYEWLDSFEDAYLLCQLEMTRKQHHEIVMIAPGSNRSIDKDPVLYNKALELEHHVIRYMNSLDVEEEEDVDDN